MDKFTPDILILGYSGNKTEVRTFSLTGLSPSLVGRSRAVLLTFGFVTSFKSLTPQASSEWAPDRALAGQGTLSRDVKNSSVSPLLPRQPINKLTDKRFRLCPFRSPLLRVSILFLFLWVLRCFTPPGILPPTVTSGNNCGLRNWVSPFGYLRIKAC